MLWMLLILALGTALRLFRLTRWPLEGEEIHTEIACKFTRVEVEDNFTAAGIHLDEWLTDSKDQFAMALGSRA